jgi:hypothetical protein
VTTPLPYVPYAPGQAGTRMFYTSTCQVLRLNPVLGAGGGFTSSWDAVETVVDPVLGEPGLLKCRLDLLFVRPGKDQPMPIVAGRAPDRIGVCYYDLATDQANVPLVLAGDRLKCVAGPIFGTFDIRVIPDVAQDMIGAHHIEVQVVEVSQMLRPGSPTPYPGSAG